MEQSNRIILVVLLFLILIGVVALAIPEIYLSEGIFWLGIIFSGMASSAVIVLTTHIKKYGNHIDGENATYWTWAVFVARAAYIAFFWWENETITTPDLIMMETVNFFLLAIEWFASKIHSNNKNKFEIECDKWKEKEREATSNLREKQKELKAVEASLKNTREVSEEKDKKIEKMKEEQSRFKNLLYLESYLNSVGMFTVRGKPHIIDPETGELVKGGPNSQSLSNKDGEVLWTKESKSTPIIRDKTAPRLKNKPS